MKSLAIDTSTETLALCARRDDNTASLSFRHGLQHAPALIPLVDRLLADLGIAVSELDLLACSIGPGSFTGIRIGLATAKGIAMATSCPLVGVSTLDALALPYDGFEGDVYPIVDARKGMYYTALFRGGVRVSDYLDIAPEVLKSRLSAALRALLVGPDAEAIRDRLFGEEDRAVGARVFASPFTDPLALLRLGERLWAREGAAPEGPVPLYLRKSEAELAKGKPS